MVPFKHCCQLFVSVALGETLLATGGVLSEVEHWSGDVVSAVLATFAGTIAMWWLYFGISSRDATAANSAAMIYMKEIRQLMLWPTISCQDSKHGLTFLPMELIFPTLDQLEGSVMVLIVLIF